MARPPWQILFGSGVVVAVASAPFGETAQALVLLTACLIGAVSVAAGVRIHKPESPSPWFSLGSMLVLLLFAYGLTAVDPTLGSDVRAGFNLGNALNVLAVFMAVFAFHRFGRLRAHTSDPTNLIDALVMAGGVGIVVAAGLMVPYLGNSALALDERVMGAAFTLMDLLLFAMVTRLAIGPGAKNPSYYMVVCAVACALLTDLAISLDQIEYSFAGETALIMLFPTLAFVLIGTAALHPSMKDMARPVSSEVGRMTVTRFVLMTIAVLMPLCVLVVKGPTANLLTWLVPCWLAMTTLVMARFGGLVRAQERVSAQERVLNEAAALLVSASDRSEIQNAALSALRQLLGAKALTYRISVVMNDNQAWTVAVSSGTDSHLAQGRVIPMDDVVAALAKKRRTDTHEDVALDLQIGESGYSTVAPLVGHGEIFGALYIFSTTPLEDGVVTGVERLALNVSQAFEAAILTEDLHRRRSDQRFRALVENSGDVIVAVHEDDDVCLSPAAERLLRQPGRVRKFIDCVIEQDRDEVAELIETVRETGASSRSIQVRIEGNDGICWLQLKATDMAHLEDVRGVVINAHDVTDTKVAEAERDRSQARFSALVQHSSDVIAVVDEDLSCSYVSPSCENLFGYEAALLTGRHLASLVHPDDQAAIAVLLHHLDPSRPSSRPRKIEIRVRSSNAEWKTLDVTVTDLRHEPSVGGIVLNAHDVSERKLLEDNLRHRVLHDDLTGIPNRVLFRERVGHALAGQRRSSTTTATLFIDLDDFKTINDGLGHEVGDELLRVIAFRLDAFVRSDDTAARLGGDEFAVLLENMRGPGEAVEVAARLLEIISEPIDFDGREITITGSVGIAFADESSTPEALLRNADVAMYHAKSKGKGRLQLFDEAMYVSALERLELKADLARAVERDELELFYQPLVSLSTGALTGFEALLRWNHPERGWVSPGSFVPIAEETGLIVPIGNWVLRSAMSQLSKWRKEFPEIALTMSINVAPRQLEEEEIVSEVAALIVEHRVDPSWVTLELTESAVLDDPICRERMSQLGRLGVGIAADDFGSGFASYAALQQLPFTTVKIDRSLLIGLSTSVGRAEAQLQSIIDMAHATGLNVVAEGIEELSQRNSLAAMGCDRGQGFLFGRPTAAAEASKLLSAPSTITI